MSRLLRLVKWIDRLTLAVVPTDYSIEDHHEWENQWPIPHREECMATKDTLIAEIRVIDEEEPWIVGMIVSDDTPRIVLVPWWYFEEVK